MQKSDIKKSDKIESDSQTNILYNKNNLYSLYLKALTDNIKKLQKNNLIPKEKNLREKINLYFSQITSAIKLLTNEIESIISKYESILKLIEEKNRKLYSDIFNLHIKNTFLESNIEILTKKEKEYKLVKEKTGIVVENGIIIYNDRKENEIFILRKENSTLKNEIIKIEAQIGDLNEKFNKEKEKYEKEILILNEKIDKYKFKNHNIKKKGKSCSCIKINSNGKTADVNLKNEKTKEANIPSIDSFMAYSENYIKDGIELPSKMVGVSLIYKLLEEIGDKVELLKNSNGINN